MAIRLRDQEDRRRQRCLLTAHRSSSGNRSEPMTGRIRTGDTMPRCTAGWGCVHANPDTLVQLAWRQRAALRGAGPAKVPGGCHRTEGRAILQP